MSDINIISRYSEILDSGERTEFATGAVRDMHEGKGRFDLMPLGVIGRLVQCYAEVAATPDAEYLAPLDAFSLIHSFKEDKDVSHLYRLASYFICFTQGTADAIYAFLLKLAKQYENGAKKYGENNWQKGIPVHSCIDSALRHYTKYMLGMVDEPHDVAFVWNLVTAIYMMEYHPELDDFTIYSGEAVE